MSSDDLSSRGGNSNDEEKEVHVQKLADGILDGSMVMKNGDGTYKCPLSPERKKQRYTYCELQTHATQYKYRELLGLADATQIGSGKKGPEKVSGHAALEKFLDNKPMVAHLEQAVPSRGAGATRLLAPWMGILVNIDHTRTNAEGRRLAAGGADIKEKFQEYNPEKVEVFPDCHGDQGTAVLTFRNDIHGLEDAQAFAHSFATANCGSKDWWDEKRAYNLDLYGWQATEEDLIANLGQMMVYLKNFCELKSVKDMVEEKERTSKHIMEEKEIMNKQTMEEKERANNQLVEEKERLNKQIVEDLVKKMDQKNDMMAASRHQFVILRDMVHEVNSLRVKAEEEKRTMEEQHKRDLEAMQLQLQGIEARSNERLLAHQARGKRLQELEGQYADLEARRLQVQVEAARNERELAFKENMVRMLEGHCAVSEKADRLIRQINEGERQRYEREKQDARRLLDEANKQVELQAANQCKLLDEQKRIIKKHEGEIKALEMALLDQKRKGWQELALQKQRGKELLKIVKLEEMDQEKLEALQSELEMLQDMVNALTQKERTVNGFLEDARKVAVQVLETYGVDEKISNKLMGTIDKGPWEAACRKKFKCHVDGWEMVMTKMISEWENRIGNHEYHPYKNLKLGPEGNEWKRIIDEDDEFIKKLKEDLGAEVMQTVATAFFEIEEYNASGRYPMWVAWNFEKKEQVQLKDLLMFMKELLDDATMSKRKRARANQ